MNIIGYFLEMAEEEIPCKVRLNVYFSFVYLDIIPNMFFLLSLLGRGPCTRGDLRKSWWSYLDRLFEIAMLNWFFSLRVVILAITYMAIDKWSF